MYRAMAALSLLPALLAAAPAAALHTGLERCPSPLVRGTDAGERLLLSRPARVMAYGGDDLVLGSRRRDCIYGGDGRNRIEGAGGNDVLMGGFSRRPLATPDGAYRIDRPDRIDGGSGDDAIDGWGGPDLLEGGRGDDRIEGWDGRDTILGGPGDDAIGGGVGPNTIDGGAGNDRVSAANGTAETVRCGPGRDLLRADFDDTPVGCERVRRSDSRLPRAYLAEDGGMRVAFVAPLAGWYVVFLNERPRCAGGGSEELPGTTSIQGVEVDLRVGPVCRGDWRISVSYSLGFASRPGPAVLPWCDRSVRDSEGCVGTALVRRFTFNVR